jgi:hypothetical protein
MSATLAWALKRGLLKLRWPGLLGLGLLAAAAAIYAAGVLPAQLRLAALDAESARLDARLGGRGKGGEPASGGSQLETFYRFFPAAAALPELLRQIQRAAEANGLRLEKGEYRLNHEGDFPLARYLVTLPLRGGYGEVRKFVNDVLDAVPAAALEDLTLRREAIDDAQVEARVRFVLFLGVR